MSRQTNITLSFPESLAEPTDAISEIWKMIGSDLIVSGTRTLGESHEFDLLSAYWAEESDEEDEDSEHLGNTLSLNEVSGLYREGTCLQLFFQMEPLLLVTLNTELRAVMDQDDVGDFWLNGVSISVGDHDVIINPSGNHQLSGRYGLSLVFSGHEMPIDLETMESELPKLAEFRRFRTQLERRYGPASIAFLYA